MGWVSFCTTFSQIRLASLLGIPLDNPFFKKLKLTIEVSKNFLNF
jgi:hypothetical protein